MALIVTEVFCGNIWCDIIYCTLLSKLAGIVTWVSRKLRHFELSVAVHGLRLAFLLSKFLDQESGICTTAVASRGGGWKG